MRCLQWQHDADQFRDKGRLYDDHERVFRESDGSGGRRHPDQESFITDTQRLDFYQLPRNFLNH
jgi:hypothetical protein